MMKKILFAACLGMMVGMGAVAGSALAGPPEGGGIAPKDGPISVKPTKPGSVPGTGIILYGPPEGGG